MWKAEERAKVASATPPAWTERAKQADPKKADAEKQERRVGVLLPGGSAPALNASGRAAPWRRTAFPRGDTVVTPAYK